MKNKVLILIVTLIFVGSIIYLQYFSYRELSVSSIESNPQIYNFAKVKLRGMVIENTGMFFGSNYELAGFEQGKIFDIKDASQIALGLKGGSNIDLTNYVSYYFDGLNYTEGVYKPVVVTGTIKYLGEVMDAPPFYLELESVKIELD